MVLLFLDLLVLLEFSKETLATILKFYEKVLKLRR